MRNPILGLILIILGSIITLAVASEFIVRAIIAGFGLYLIYQGMLMRNPHHRAMFMFRNFRGRW